MFPTPSVLPREDVIGLCVCVHVCRQSMSAEKLGGCLPGSGPSDLDGVLLAPPPVNEGQL